MKQALELETDYIDSNSYVFWSRGWEDCVNKKNLGITSVADGISKLSFERGLRRLPPFSQLAIDRFILEYRKGWSDADKAIK